MSRADRTTARELVWMHIKNNPHVTIKDLAEYLGKDGSYMQLLVRELYKARMVERTECQKPAGYQDVQVRYYTYHTQVESYRWEPVAKLKKAKRAAQLARDAQQPVEQPVQPMQKITATRSIINILDTLPVRDVLLIKNYILEMMR
jgi:predicted transcriptional regulator